VVKLIYTYLNSIFDMDVTFTANYFSVGGDVLVDSEMLLVTDFVNFKIKLAQYFRCTHRGRMCIYVFIWVSTHTYMSICVCVSQTKL
jgi:hypothetical protein